MAGWGNAWFCALCDAELSFGQVMHSNGRCPHCGGKDKHAGTVVKTYERAYRIKRAGPWWAFWRVSREFLPSVSDGLIEDK